MWDVAIIGAGLSGIACARALTAQGYGVCLLDKSRGLGGRMATRRVSLQQSDRPFNRLIDRPLNRSVNRSIDRPMDYPVDHGLRHWQPASAALQKLTEELVEQGVLKPWLASAYEIRDRGVLIATNPSKLSPPKYMAPAGMSAIAKHLLRDFTLGENWLSQHKAINISYRDSHWQIECEQGQQVRAKQCVIAIPAPQAVDLLKGFCKTDSFDDLADNLPDHLAGNLADNLADKIAQLKAITYFPCITVLAGYHSRYSADMGELNPQGWMVSDRVGTSTDWTGLDSSKRSHSAGSKPNNPVIVIHSKATFAEQYIDARDLQPAASVLLRANARKLGSWIAQPEWFQIHRWRYAQVNRPYGEERLAIANTLICGGDWCVPADKANSEANLEASPEAPAWQNIDHAYRSGLAMAAHIKANDSQPL